MLSDIQVSRCETHNCPSCPVCRLERIIRAEEQQTAINQAMHDLAVWTLCRGCTGLDEVFAQVYELGTKEGAYL